MRIAGMRKKTVVCPGREFVFLSCEGAGSGTAAGQMEGIFEAIRTELQKDNLSLDQTIRTRLWAVDRDSRDRGSDTRAGYNVGQARAATSSYIAPGHFASDALVGLDLVALKSAGTDSRKILVESEPPRKPLSYLVLDSLVVLSGKTVVLPTLPEQLDEILPRITGILAHAGSNWDRVVNISCHLHRSQTIETLREGFARWVKTPIPGMEIVPVDGYSAPGKLIEVEVTADNLDETCLR